MAEKRDPQEFSDEEQPSNKARRVARACLQCRARKQRCLPSSEIVTLQASCKRCEKHGLNCSFQNDRIIGPEETPGPSRMVEIVVELHQKINQHEARISELENRASSTVHQQQFSNRTSLNCQQSLSNEEDSVQPKQTHQTVISPYESSVSNSPSFTLDGIDLGPPIATLRSLGALAKDEPTSNPKPLAARKNQASPQSIYDPVAEKILSLQEADKAIAIFFDYCHAMAPVLNENIRNSWQAMRLTSPVLFLAICSIGTRFRETHHPNDGIHSQIFQMTALFDKAVSRLLLRPTPSDVTLDSIRVLLLYAQWMPCSWENEDEPPVKNATQCKTFNTPKSRYNEISAWAVLGLALRYALFLGLDRAAIAPFQGPVRPISQEDMSCLRVWYNLLTCDFNLMLTSGQPASLDPLVSSQVARRFSSSRHAQQPADLRVAGLVELVAVVYRAMKSCGDVSGRQLDSYCLRRVNTELEEWERSWLALLGHTESQHNQLPFNSVRWYRLSLNSAKLGPLLSSMRQPSYQPLQISLLQSFEISLTAAAQILFSLSASGSKYVWKLDSQNRASFPGGPFQVDIDAVRRLHYAVDSTWISHTFAVTFLVLCYIRGAIDENIQIRSLNPNAPANPTLLTPHSDSIMARLLHLALEIFDNVCSTANIHPARDFQAIVHDATSLVLSPGNVQAQEGQEVDELALQSLFDMMNDAGLEWPGNLFDTTGDFSGGWDIGGEF